MGEVVDWHPEVDCALSADLDGVGIWLLCGPAARIQHPLVAILGPDRGDSDIGVRVNSWYVS